MDYKKVIKSILSKDLHIYKKAGMQMLDKFVAFADAHLPEDLKKAKLDNAISFYNPHSQTAITTTIGNLQDAPFGSIGVVPVSGALMRESYCSMAEGYVKGTRELEQDLLNLEASDKVDAVVIRLSSPGGQALGSESLNNAIRRMTKPVLVSFDMMASAAIASFISASKIYAVEKGAIWGSIGTMVTIADTTEFMRELGIDIRDIYAPESDLKNYEYRQAIEGNDQPMEQRLSDTNQIFIKNVKKARKDMSDDGRVFRGAIYTAQQAKKLGAIDGIMPYDQVLQEAARMGRRYRRDKDKNRNSSTQQLQKNHTQMAFQEDKQQNEQEESRWNRFLNKWWNGKQQEEKQQVQQETVEGLQAKLSESTQSASDLQKQNAKLGEENAELKAKIEQLEASQTELQGNVAQLQEQNDKYAADMAHLEKLDLNKDEETVTTVQASVERTNKIFAHNKELAPTPSTVTPSSNVDEDVTARQEIAQQAKKTTAQRVAEMEAKVAAEQKAYLDQQKSK